PTRRGCTSHDQSHQGVPTARPAGQAAQSEDRQSAATTPRPRTLKSAPWASTEGAVCCRAAQVFDRRRFGHVVVASFDAPVLGHESASSFESMMTQSRNGRARKPQMSLILLACRRKRHREVRQRNTVSRSTFSVKRGHRSRSAPILLQRFHAVSRLRGFRTLVGAFLFKTLAGLLAHRLPRRFVRHPLTPSYGAWLVPVTRSYAYGGCHRRC